MTTKLKLALAVLCVGALTSPLAMAQTAPATQAAAAPAAAKEFVAETPNVPQLNRPQVTPRNGVTCGGLGLPPCGVPEPGSIPLVAAAALAAFAVMRRKK